MKHALIPGPGIGLLAGCTGRQPTDLPPVRVERTGRATPSATLSTRRSWTRSAPAVYYAGEVFVRGR